MKKIPRFEAIKGIEEFFKDITERTPKEIKKIKRLARSINFPIKELRKIFCKKCFTPYKNPKIRVKNKIKTIICNNCNYLSRYKLKN